MKYKTTNETENFSYQDCVIREAHINNDAISLMVEALIVKSTNSKNSNYTDSYADETQVAFIRSAICNVVKLGYKRYNADDVLIEEIKDEEVALSHSELKSLLIGAYLTGIEKSQDDTYRVNIEIGDEDPTAITDEYELTITCDEIIIEWDKYLNKVSQNG